MSLLSCLWRAKTRHRCDELRFLAAENAVLRAENAVLRAEHEEVQPMLAH